MKHLLVLAITTLLAIPTPSLAAPTSLNARQTPINTLLHSVSRTSLLDQNLAAQKSNQRMTYVNAYGLDSADADGVLNAGIWENPCETCPDTPAGGNGQVPWALVQGYDQAAYVKEFFALRDERGFRPRVVKGYNVGVGNERGVFFSAVWEKRKEGEGNGAWEHRVGMSQGGFKKVLEELLEKGYRVTHLSGYEEGGEGRYTAIWEKNEDDPVKGWYALVNLSKEEYEAQLERFEGLGYAPAVVDGYVVGEEVKYAALWEKRDAIPKRVEKHDLSEKEFRAEVEKLKDECFEVIVVSQYGKGDGSVRYAGIWERL